MPRPFTRPSLWDMLAPALILVAPTIAFAAYHGYGYFTAEFLVAVGATLLVGAGVGMAIMGRGAWPRALAVAAFLTLFVDIQFHEVLKKAGGVGSVVVLILAFAVLAASGLALRRHLTQILATVFGVIIVTTLAFPPYGEVSRIVTADDPPTLNSDLPTVIHILLDEHIGVEGIPTDIAGGVELKEEIKAFYRQRGFYVFGKAFSRFDSSVWSISHMMNNADDRDEDLIGREKSDYKYGMNQNSYLKSVANTGYAFNIYQSNYLDFCSLIKDRLSKCLVYDVTSIKRLQDLPLNWTRKIKILSVFYFSETLFYRFAFKVYWALSNFLGGPETADGIWHGERLSISPVASLAVLDSLEADLLTASRGKYYFAHVAVPHAPYLYEPDCSIADTSLWTNSRTPKEASSKSNSPYSRNLRNQRYFAQVRCTYTRLARLLDTVERIPALADAVVLLHGDHGSRITVSHRKTYKKGLAGPADYIASFSTLLAVSASGIDPGYDLHPWPVHALIDRLRAGGFDSLPDNRNSPSPQMIFLETDDIWTRIPMPEFGAVAAD